MPQDNAVDVAPMTEWAVWRGDDVPIWDLLPAAWRWRVLELVDAFNQILPDRAPRLIHHAINEIRCEDMPVRLKERRGIAICLVDELETPQTAATIDPYVVGDHVLKRMTIRLRSDNVPTQDPLCHELMHALTDIADRDDLPHEWTSCVWGHLRTPGTFDEHYPRWAYRKYASFRRREAWTRNGRSSPA